MAIGTIADDTIDPGHEQESAPRFPQLGVLEEARRRPGFPGSELAWAPDRSSRFALTTLWESTGACSAWQTQQLLPVPREPPGRRRPRPTGPRWHPGGRAGPSQRPRDIQQRPGRRHARPDA